MLPSDRWTNHMNQSGNWDLSITLYQLLAGQLDRMASNSRILVQ